MISSGKLVQGRAYIVAKSCRSAVSGKTVAVLSNGLRLDDDILVYLGRPGDKPEWASMAQVYADYENFNYKVILNSYAVVLDTQGRVCLEVTGVNGNDCWLKDWRPT